MAQTTKQKFVDVTYYMIKEKALENLKVRDIAKRVGCTAAALYKHFETMDYLIMVASIRFLDDYMMELMELTESEQNSIEINLAAWKAFNKYAFANPPIFIHLFWGAAGADHRGGEPAPPAGGQPAVLRPESGRCV